MMGWLQNSDETIHYEVTNVLPAIKVFAITADLAWLFPCVDDKFERISIPNLAINA